MIPLRIVVMASGEGSNFQALIDAIESREVRGLKIVALVSDTPGARAIARATRHGIPSHILPCPEGARRGSSARSEFDARLASIVASFRPDFVLMLGWMRLLGCSFLGQFPGKVINLHPALPGAFPGTHAIERAYEAFHRGEIVRTGVMLHLVPDDGVDSGPTLKVAEISLRDGETFEEFEARVHAKEHRLVVELARELGLRGELPAPHAPVHDQEPTEKSNAAAEVPHADASPRLSLEKEY